jgi:predicted porin
MINFIHYIPAGEKVTPYLRTAIGINTWQQNYVDPQGNKINLDGTPSELAYQVGLGADIYLSKNAGIFLEGGYGKYILHGGLTFKF